MSSSLLLEAALRSVLLALAVWAGLRLFGVKNVLAQKAAWGLVLVSALGMPVLLPYAAHWSVLPANVRVVIPDDPQTLLEELQARIKTSPQPKPLSEVTPVAQAPSPGDESSTEMLAESSSFFFLSLLDSSADIVGMKVSVSVRLAPPPGNGAG